MTGSNGQHRTGGCRPTVTPVLDQGVADCNGCRSIRSNSDIKVKKYYKITFIYKKKKQILYQVAVVLCSIKRGTPQQLLEVSRMFHKHLPAKKGKENNP